MKTTLDIIIDYINSREKIDIRSNCRRQYYADLRFIYFHIALNKVEGYTYEEVGKAVNRHHATVVHGLHEYWQKLHHKDWVKQLVTELIYVVYPLEAIDKNLTDIKDEFLKRVQDAYIQVLNDIENPYMKDCMKVPKEKRAEFIETRLKPYLRSNC